MKKILIIIPIISLMVLTGCESKQDKYNKIMIEYARTYYEKYMTTPGLDIAEITIDMLKIANTEVDAGFNLSKLDKCKGESKIELHIIKDTRIIDYYDIDMKCEK